MAAEAKGRRDPIVPVEVIVVQPEPLTSTGGRPCAEIEVSEVARAIG